jgi:hypothetical protein
MTTHNESEATEARLSTADFAAARSAAEREPIERQTQDRAPSNNTPLFVETEAGGFRDRWTDIQASFVDEPRNAVEQADTLVAEVMQRLAQVFADERQRLEQQWDRGSDTDTEELRQALRRYRSFFDRLLSM